MSVCEKALQKETAFHGPLILNPIVIFHRIKNALRMKDSSIVKDKITVVRSKVGGALELFSVRKAETALWIIIALRMNLIRISFP